MTDEEQRKVQLVKDLMRRALLDHEQELTELIYADWEKDPQLQFTDNSEDLAEDK